MTTVWVRKTKELHFFIYFNLKKKYIFRKMFAGFGFHLNPYLLTVLLSISFNKSPCSSVSLSSGANGCSLKPVMLDNIRKVASDLRKEKYILRIFFYIVKMDKVYHHFSSFFDNLLAKPWTSLFKVFSLWFSTRISGQTWV